MGRIDAIKRRSADEGDDFQSLTGIEVKVLRDGLDLPNELRGRLDIVFASMHVASGEEAKDTLRLAIVESTCWAIQPAGFCWNGTHAR